MPYLLGIALNVQRQSIGAYLICVHTSSDDDDLFILSFSVPYVLVESPQQHISFTIQHPTC